MSTPQIELTGTPRADGTVKLDQQPTMTPGRVRLVMQPVIEQIPPSESLTEFVEESRRELEAAGSHFMNDDEVAAHIDGLREGDVIDEVLRQADEERTDE